MIRKILFGLLMALVLAAGFIGYRFYVKLKMPQTLAINAIPTNAAMIIESRDFQLAWDKMRTLTLFWRNLSDVDFIKELNQKTRFLDSLFSSEGRVAQLIKGRPAIISVHLTGANNYNYLFLASLQNIISISELDAVVAGAAKTRSIRKRSYDNVEISEIELEKGNTFSYTFYSGIFIGSYSSMLVEDAIRQVQSGTSLFEYSSNPGFKKVHNTSGINADANIYLNFQVFPRFLAGFAGSGKQNLILSLKNLANWTELDLAIKPQALMLNGLTLPNDSTDKFLNIFLNQSPRKIELPEILPDNTARFIYLGFENLNSYYKAYIDYLERSNQFYDYNQQIVQIAANYKIDIETDILPIIKNEICLVTTGNINSPNPISDALSEYLVMRLTDLESGKKAIKAIETKISEIAGDSLPENIEPFREHDIGIININSFWQKLLGPVFGGIKANYYTFIEDYVVFGNSVNELESFIGTIISERTLKHDIHYNKFTDNISSKANCYLYYNIPICLKTGLVQSSFSELLANSVNQNMEPLQEFEALSIQLSASAFPEYIAKKGQMLYTNVYLSYNPDYKEKTQLFNQSLLDAPLKGSPWVVINHYTGNHEIFVQDEANQVYLIDKSGNILWKLKLSEKIISEVHQIDIYNNNKFQLLFNTESKLYLIDRKGRNVENYPIELKAPASNGLSVFDYDNNRNYRIFVACRNNGIYAYDKAGKPIEGWEFGKTSAPVQSKISHIVVKGKDYLVFIDSKGKIYAVDRKGQSRLEVKKQFKYLFDNTYYIDYAETIENTKIFASDSTGIVYGISFDNKMDSLVFDDFAYAPFFNYVDIDHDGSKDFMFLDQNELLIYNKEAKVIFNKSFDYNIAMRPLVFTISGKTTLIGVVSDKSQELFVYTPDGTIATGGPLYGNTAFNVMEENGQLMLVAGAPGKSLYIYNLE